MDLRRLRYFVVVAEELNFSRAAERLHIAQPPLSQQIRTLEGELGVQLFDRSKRSIQLTEAGRTLLEEARRILVQLDQTSRLVRRVGTGRVGRLSLGFVPSASNDLLPRILRAFRAEYPEVELFLNELNPDQVVQRLHDKRVDAGFFYLPFSDAALEVRPVSREPLVLALPESHPLSGEPEVDLRAVADEHFILPMRHQMPGLYAKVTELCSQAGFTPEAVQREVWLMQTIVGLVAGGIGVALVPSSLQNLRRQGVVYKTVRDLSQTVEMGVVCRRDDRLPVLAAFLEVAYRWSQESSGAVGGEQQNPVLR